MKMARLFLALLLLFGTFPAVAAPQSGPIEWSQLPSAQQVFNVIDPPYGAKCDGTTDDTTAIAAANAAANSAGGGRVQFPAGTCVTGQQTIYPHVSYVGMGADTTTIQLKAGANQTVFLGQNFASLTGTNATTGVGGFQFFDMTIDGNSGSNSGSGDGIQVYGYGFRMQNIRIKNTVSDGLYTEWSTSGSCPTNSPNGCMEAYLSNVYIFQYGGNGWTFEGPHDTMFDKLIMYTFNNTSAKGLYLTTANGPGLVGTNVHIWGSNQWGIYADQNSASTLLTNVELEGATSGQAMVGGGGIQLNNLWMYNCATTSVTAQQTTATNLSITVNGGGIPIVPGMVVSGTGITAGTIITAGSGKTGNFTTSSSTTSSSETVSLTGAGLWYGDSANNGTEGTSRISTYTSACGFNWTYQGSNNILDATMTSAPTQLSATPSYSNIITNWTYLSGNPAMVASACGSSPSVFNATLGYGYVVLGSGSPTSCTLTVPSGFNWPRQPQCVVSSDTGTSPWRVTAVNNTSVTFGSASTATTIYYQCHAANDNWITGNISNYG